MDTSPLSSDDERLADLLDRIRQGEAAAWDEFFDQYHDELLFSIRARLGTRLRGFLESEDVFQSVAIEALKALPRFEPRHPGSFKGFLNRIVLNKIRDRAAGFSAKKRAGGVPLTDSVLERTPGEVRYREPERYLQLEQCLQKLPDDMRQVLLLRKVDGLSSRDAAEKLGRSDAATRKLYSRALARLAASMHEETES
ncbi:MAG: sigma-70 family RNA polymerase sigma factor [Planctomycetota bacterium]